MPVKILAVGGRQPQSLADFEGDTAFVLEGQAAYTVQGTGRLTGDSVRFHQKDMEHNGKDIRVWQIQRRGEDYVAEPAATF